MAQFAASNFKTSRFFGLGW